MKALASKMRRNPVAPTGKKMLGKKNMESDVRLNPSRTLDFVIKHFCRSLGILTRFLLVYQVKMLASPEFFVFL
jgi:hypothetical protein